MTMKLDLTNQGVQLSLGSVPGVMLIPYQHRVGNILILESVLTFGTDQTSEVIDWLKSAATLLEKYAEAKDKPGFDRDTFIGPIQQTLTGRPIVPNRPSDQHDPNTPRNGQENQAQEKQEQNPAVQHNQ